MFNHREKALTWREILKTLEIEPKDPNQEILDPCPEILTDDGMGYGVQESWVIEVDKECNRLWREHKKVIQRNEEFYKCINHLKSINKPIEEIYKLMEEWENETKSTSDILSLTK